MSLFRQCALFGVVAGLGAQASPGAEVVLTNGRTLEVTAWAADGGKVRMTFPGGGELTFPLEQVRAIRPSEAIPEPPSGAAPEPTSGVVAVRAAEADPVPAAHLTPAAPQTLPDSDTPGVAGTDMDAVIDALAARHGVSPRLVRAVIETESAWNPRAVSRKGAAGLMQLMPGTARGHGVTDPFDPAQNLGAGVAELGEHLRRYHGEMSLALAAYNAGGKAVARHGGIPPYRETIHYVRQVLDRYFTAADLPRLGTGAP